MKASAHVVVIVAVGAALLAGGLVGLLFDDGWGAATAAGCALLGVGVFLVDADAGRR